MKHRRTIYFVCTVMTTLALLCGCTSQKQNVNTIPEQVPGTTQSPGTAQVPGPAITPEVTETPAIPENLTVRSYSEEWGLVKHIGRTHSENGILWLAQSASGIEFTFRGDSASITLVGDGAARSDKNTQARFAIYINGERTMDEQIDSAEKSYDIFSSQEPMDVTIKLLKLSEAANSTFGIESIRVSSVDEIAPTEEKQRRIEFIGDSITCGYGVDDEVKEHHFSTSTEDATKAYAYKTAEMLDADYSLVSYSGHGIISGYTNNGKKQDTQCVPKLYGQFARTYGSSRGYYNEEAQWDFGRFVPDVVVINLGTNDHSYTGSEEGRVAEYKKAYMDFITMIRSNNPDAYIICTLGVMGDELYGAIKEMVGDYIAATGDEKVSSLRLTPQNGSTGFAADWHPTEATHEKAAKELAGYIRSIMGE